MRYFIAILFCFSASAEPMRVMILDSGYNPKLFDKDAPRPKICKDGHFDFITGTNAISYVTSHGTAVAAAMLDELEGEEVDYCLSFVQLYGKNGLGLEGVRAGLQHAIKWKPAAINLSIEGFKADFRERESIKTLTMNGTKVFIAAGNSGRDLGQLCVSYPACYKFDGAYIVGALTEDGMRVPRYSNYGQGVDLWFPGFVRIGEREFYGTSFASPRALGSWLKMRQDKKKKQSK